MKSNQVPRNPDTKVIVEKITIALSDELDTVTDVDLQMLFSPRVPESVPEPDTALQLYMDITLQSKELDFSDPRTYSELPRFTILIGRSADGTCDVPEVFVYNEENGRWETEPPYVVDWEQTDSSCLYEVAVPHFSQFAIGIKPMGGGGIGARGGGSGGGIALADGQTGSYVEVYCIKEVHDKKPISWYCERFV